MRLIDADALLDAISVHLERIEQEFEDAPTIDPVRDPVRRGRWVIESGEGAMCCNSCGLIYEYYGGLEEEWNYCPYCGARMDGGTDNETD